MKHSNMKRRDSLISYGIMLLMFSALFFAAATRAQSQTAQPPPTESPTAQPSMMPPQGRDDVTMQQLVDFGDFLNRHPEIADQLRRDPSLVDNQDFVNKHPELQEFLQQHPEIRAELSRNPDGFMRQEDRLDRREEDPNRAQLADMDQFLNRHPEIAEQLRKDPSLVDNKQFVKNHPALQQFLADHVGVREEYKENPNAFMHDEERFDRREDSYSHGDRDTAGTGLSSFNEFMEGHRDIASELSKTPSLANNQEYLENHPALQDYLKAHPEIHEELSRNPQGFLESAQQFNAHSTQKLATDSKLK